MDMVHSLADELAWKVVAESEMMMDNSFYIAMAVVDADADADDVVGVNMSANLERKTPIIHLIDVYCKAMS